jgi:hypothetical protein
MGSTCLSQSYRLGIRAVHCSPPGANKRYGRRGYCELTTTRAILHLDPCYYISCIFFSCPTSRNQQIYTSYLSIYMCEVSNPNFLECQNVHVTASPGIDQLASGSCCEDTHQRFAAAVSCEDTHLILPFVRCIYTCFA